MQMPIMQFCLQLLIAAVFIEAVTELLCEGVIFDTPRLWLCQRNRFICDLITCPYCTSVWVAIATVFIPLWIQAIFVTHRLANIFHALIIHKVRLK